MSDELQKPPARMIRIVRTKKVADRLLTEKDLAQKFQCHPDSVAALEKDGLPVVRLTPRIKRYDPQAVADFIQTKTVKSIS